MTKYEKYKIILVSLFVLICGVCFGQIKIKIEKDISYPDYSIKISEDVSYPDIRVKIGEDISYEDFTVGITDNKNLANFIITDSNYPDWKVRASADVSYPDIRIKIGPDTSYPDVRIELKRSGTVDYIVYSEKITLSIEDLVVCVLPAINKFLNYKYEKIPKIE